MSARKRGRTNVAASVHARLLRLAKHSNEDFNALLVRFASERLLYRLSESGAQPWTARPYRETTCFPLPNVEINNNPNIQS